jgi:hypothetical protein
MLTTLVDDWDYLAREERKALVTEVFEEITASERGIEDFLPTEPWKRYMRTAVPSDVDRVLSGRRDPMCPMLKQAGCSETTWVAPGGGEGRVS